MSEIDVKECRYNWDDTEKKRKNQCSIIYGNCKDFKDCYYRQLQQLKAENEELHKKCAKIIYNVTGGRLSYSTYTIEAVGQAFYDQLDIMVEKKTQELEQEIEELRNQIFNWEEINKLQEKYKQCLDEIEDLCKIAKNSNTGFYTLCDVVMLKIKEVKGNERNRPI